MRFHDKNLLLRIFYPWTRIYDNNALLVVFCFISLLIKIAFSYCKKKFISYPLTVADFTLQQQMMTLIRS